MKGTVYARMLFKFYQQRVPKMLDACKHGV